MQWCIQNICLLTKKHTNTGKNITQLFKFIRDSETNLKVELLLKGETNVAL